MNRMSWTLGAFGVVVMATAAYVGAQGQDRTDNSPLVLPNHNYDLPATLITAAQQQEHLNKMKAAGDDDIPMNMVKMGGGDPEQQVGVSIVYREQGGPRPGYAVHDDVAEVYYVLEGKGKMKLGGKITDWKRRPISAGNGRGSAGTVATGSKDVNIAKGDILIIPAGTPHKWEGAEAFTAYAVVRIDPDGVAPLLDLGKAEFPPAKKQ